MSVQELVDLWENERPKYEKLGKIIYKFISDFITEYEILPTTSYRTKELISIVKKVDKKSKEGKQYSYHDIKDKLGIRIICAFQEEMTIIDEFIAKYFNIIKAEYKQTELDFNKLDYISNHYDVTIKNNVKRFKRLVEFNDLVFEIQVRTLNQHAWSNAAHYLTYKQDTELPKKSKRKIYRLLSLYELADDEFSFVYNELTVNDKIEVFSILRKTEGKFYKFVKMSFDRELSLFYIDKLLGYIESSDIRQKMVATITQFIEENELKIKRIYNENRNRLYDILILTQPEIFVVWYMLENSLYTLKDNWSKDFPEDDFEQIKTLWGNDL